jgi:hypothetical protein
MPRVIDGELNWYFNGTLRGLASSEFRKGIPKRQNRIYFTVSRPDLAQAFDRNAAKPRRQATWLPC